MDEGRGKTLQVIKSVAAVRRFIYSRKKQGKTIGFVPTMGALHAGHMSLAKRARRENSIVVASIFVNPLQFVGGEDFERYPRDFRRDESLLKQHGVDAVFYPPVADMYPEPFTTLVEETALSLPLCGESRPGHFRGVTTVVAKLFNIVQPDRAYFGQKDYQQVMVIKRMVDNLDFPVAIRVCPIVRERSGLAMSSRNEYLTTEERREAAALYRSLKTARRIIGEGVRRPRVVQKLIRRELSRMSVPFEIDYVEIRDKTTLMPVKSIDASVIVALAVRVGKARLIDNMVVNI